MKKNRFTNHLNISPTIILAMIIAFFMGWVIGKFVSNTVNNVIYIIFIPLVLAVIALFSALNKRQNEVPHALQPIVEPDIENQDEHIYQDTTTLSEEPEQVVQSNENEINGAITEIEAIIPPKVDILQTSSEFDEYYNVLEHIKRNLFLGKEKLVSEEFIREHNLIPLNTQTEQPVDATRAEIELYRAERGEAYYAIEINDKYYAIPRNRIISNNEMLSAGAQMVFDNLADGLKNINGTRIAVIREITKLAQLNKVGEYFTVESPGKVLTN
jgi:hypothetical protein